jgi:hypothetical protein
VKRKRKQRNESRTKATLPSPREGSPEELNESTQSEAKAETAEREPIQSTNSETKAKMAEQKHEKLHGSLKSETKVKQRNGSTKGIVKRQRKQRNEISLVTRTRMLIAPQTFLAIDGCCR